VHFISIENFAQLVLNSFQDNDGKKHSSIPIDLIDLHKHKRVNYDFLWWTFGKMKFDVQVSNNPVNVNLLCWFYIFIKLQTCIYPVLVRLDTYHYTALDFNFLIIERYK
jgi:hypothetical protein